MGLSKGSVIFVKLDQIELIYARFSVHKQKIEHIQELKGQNCIMTMCEEKELKIWGFQEGRMAIYRKFNLYRSISTMKILQDPTMLLMTFTSGESYYFGWSKKNKNFRIVMPEEHSDFTKD